MKSRMKRLAALGLAMMMALSLAACGGSGGSDGSGDAGAGSQTGTISSADAQNDFVEEADGPVKGGTFTTYWSEFYNEFDASVNDNRNFVDLYAESLWQIDWSKREENGYKIAYININYITGNLAESWEIADDYKSLTVHLRDGVNFADKTAVGIDEQYDIYGGRALTAADVKYSYDRVLGLDGVEKVTMDQTDWSGALKMLDSVEAPDDQTVVFNFNTDNELQVQNFMCVMLNICGPEWDALSDEQKTDWHYAGGTGAFILTDYVNDNTMTFVANPNYWQTDENGVQLPYLGEIKLVHMADTDTMLSSFIAGDLDALVANNVLIDQDQASQLDSGMGKDAYRQILFTNDAPAVCLKLGDNPVEALTSLEVREAMQYAIDQDAISTFQGYNYENNEQKGLTLFHQDTALSNLDTMPEELIESYTTYDPEKAKQLLADAGYADGFEFDVYLFQAQPIESFQLAAEYLAAVGITMNINVCSTPPEMTAHGADRTDPASMYGSVGTDKVSSISAVIRSDGPMNNVYADNEETDAAADAYAAATTLDEQIDAANNLSNLYLGQHYYLRVSHAQQFFNYMNTRVHGWNGEKWTQYYFAGDILSRIWVEE